MAAADEDMVALVAACTSIVTQIDTALNAADGYIHLTKDAAEAALRTSRAALPALVTAADAAVEALEA